MPHRVSPALGPQILPQEDDYGFDIEEKNKAVVVKSVQRGSLAEVRAACHVLVLLARCRVGRLSPGRPYLRPLPRAGAPPAPLLALWAGAREERCPSQAAPASAVMTDRLTAGGFPGTCLCPRHLEEGGERVGAGRSRPRPLSRGAWEGVRRGACHPSAGPASWEH